MPLNLNVSSTLVHFGTPVFQGPQRALGNISISSEADGLWNVQDWQNYVAPAAGSIKAVTNPNIVVGAPSIVVAPKQHQQQLQLQHEKRQHSFCRALKVATDLHAEVSMHALPAHAKPGFAVYPCPKLRVHAC